MKPLNKLILMFISLIFGMMWMLPANAVPSFSTQTEKKCSYCHTAWPQLNKKGRDFKMLGFRLSDSDPVELGDYLQDLESFPISAVVISRPIDKKEHGDNNLRALHEVEVMFAGRFNKFSAFFELEAEDEDSNEFGFDIGVPIAAMSYHHNDALNITAHWGEQFYTDPYGLLGHRLRLTRDSVGVLDTKFGGADNDGKLKSRRQNLSLWGRLFDNRLFYNMAWQGEADDKTTKSSEGKDASNWQGRLAFDITDDIMIGGFYVDGKMNAGTGLVDRDFNRWGIDGQVDYNNLRIQAAYVAAEDDSAAGIEEDNDAFSIQAFYTFKKKSGRPTFVPLIRYDWSESTNGTLEDEHLTFNLGYYVTQNVKVYAEYFHELDDFGTKLEEDRFTIQAYIAF